MIKRKDFKIKKINIFNNRRKTIARKFNKIVDPFKLTSNKKPNKTPETVSTRNTTYSTKSTLSGMLNKNSLPRTLNIGIKKTQSAKRRS